MATTTPGIEAGSFVVKGNGSVVYEVVSVEGDNISVRKAGSTSEGGKPRPVADFHLATDEQAEQYRSSVADKPRTRDTSIPEPLAVEAADSMPTGTRARHNPYIALVEQSWNAGAPDSSEDPENEGGVFVLTTDSPDRVTALLRNAATTLDLGIKIRYQDAGDGNTRVYYQARTKRERKASSNGSGEDE